MKRNFESPTIFILLIAAVLSLAACSSDNPAKNPQGVQGDTSNYSAYTSVKDQATFFETQMLVALDQLGLEEQNLPPVSLESAIRTASSDPVDDFIWDNPYGYLSDVPPAFKEELEKLVRDTIEKNEALKEVRLVHVAEHSQLVPESSADGVTEDVLALIVVRGLLPNGVTDWIATAVVKLDDWTLKQYGVNPNLVSLSKLSLDGLESYTPFIPADIWVSGFSTRRVVDNELYTSLVSSAEVLTTEKASILNPNNLSVIGVLGNNTLNRIDLSQNALPQMIKTCEACQSYLATCIPEKSSSR